MLTRRKQLFAGGASFLALALALALWGCVGTIHPSSSTKAAIPGFAIQPASQTVTVGQPANFSVTVTGTGPFTYQWQKNNANISAATSSTYTTPATVSGDNGATFRVIVTNSGGSATSGSATLTVTSAPVGPSISTQPANQTVTVADGDIFRSCRGNRAPHLSVAEK